MNRNFIALALAAAATVSIASGALAAAGETPLGNCYNLVIASCNSTSAHPIPCATNGMNQCDKKYAKINTSGPINSFSAPKPKRSMSLLLPAVQAAN